VSRRVLRVALVALVAAAALTGCGRTARDGGGQTTTLPATTPVASEIAASVTDVAPDGTTPAGDPAETAIRDAGSPQADLASASVEQRGGTLTVRVRLAHPLDPSGLGADEQVAVGAYLLANPDDVDPYAARMLLEAGAPPRFLFGPWLGTGRRIDGTLDGTELTLRVAGLDQGRFRYAQFFAEDPVGSETLPDDAAGLVAINAR
jgi:hypothetical protein